MYSLIEQLRRKIFSQTPRRGTAEDQYNLGLRYEKGMGVPQSYTEAAYWYRLAAMQGYRDGQYKLCELSEQGHGVPQDYQESLRWCGLAADQGHGRAMFVLVVFITQPTGCLMISCERICGTTWRPHMGTTTVKNGAIGLPMK